MMKAFPATIWKIGTRTTVKPQRAPKDTPKAQHNRNIKPDQQVRTRKPIVPSRRMSTFEYPLIPRLDLSAKPGLFLARPFSPVGHPVDMINIHNGKSRLATKMPRESGLARSGLPDDHDTLHCGRSPTNAKGRPKAALTDTLKEDPT